jgi:hypothetical protein
MVWYPWYRRVIMWFEKHFVTCPCCEGDGGETEVILDDGTGPYYPCEYCHETGHVINPWKRFLWWSWTHADKKAERMRRRSLLGRLK